MNQTLVNLGLDRNSLSKILEISRKKANDLLLGRKDVTEGQAEILADHFNLNPSHFMEYCEEEA